MWTLKENQSNKGEWFLHPSEHRAIMDEVDKLLAAKFITQSGWPRPSW